LEETDGGYYIKASDGRYITAVKHNVIDRYYLVLRDKGDENQVWNFEHFVQHRYRMVSATLPGAVTHAYVDHDIFILVDKDKSDVMLGVSYTNNAFITIRNV